MWQKLDLSLWQYHGPRHAHRSRSYSMDVDVLHEISLNFTFLSSSIMSSRRGEQSVNPLSRRAVQIIIVH